MYGVMRAYDESTTGYYGVQWKSEPYILQEDKEMNGYKPPVTAYAGKSVCDALFLNPIPNAKYWLTPMNQGNGDITVRLKQVLLPNITTIKIDKNNKLPKRCNKKQVEELGALLIRNDDIDELLEEIFRRDKFDTEFAIEDGVDYRENTNGD